MTGALFAGGPSGNELLTSFTGAALIVLLAALGVTIVLIGRLLWVHLFLGMLLVGPLILKLLSTGYRFTRYYTSNEAYRAKGPPPLALRLTAPIVVLSTLVVMGTGIALLLVGPSSRPSLLPIHKISFFAWLAFTAVHVLGHLPALARALRLDIDKVQLHALSTPGESTRALALAGAVAGGVVLAMLLVGDFGPWIHAQALRHHHH